MKSEYTIGKYMTKCPHTIGSDIPLSTAIEKMREAEVRHLPVQYGGKLVGILSDRDTRLAVSLHPSAKELKVSELMNEPVYAVKENCPLHEVLTNMAENKYGCAVIVNDAERVVGIFSAVDGLSLFASWLDPKKSGQPRKMHLITNI